MYVCSYLLSFFAHFWLKKSVALRLQVPYVIK
jgi:hypothetical protein